MKNNQLQISHIFPTVSTKKSTAHA